MELAKLQAEVDIEESRKQLLTIKMENDKQNATAAGEAEGLRRASSVGQFLATLKPDLPESKERLAAYRFLAGQEVSTQRSSPPPARTWAAARRASSSPPMT